MPKFLRLPSLKRCNKRGNFPFHYKKYYPQIYPDGLPNGHIPLDYSIGSKKYCNFYKAFREGYLKGIIFYNKDLQRWQYAISIEDYSKGRNKRLSLKDRAESALIKLKDLDAQMWVSLNKAANLVGFNYGTLKEHLDRENLSIADEFPTPENIKKLKLDPRTKFVVKIEALRIWLRLILDGGIISHAQPRPKDFRCTSTTSKYSARRRANLKYQDTRQVAFGTYGGWRPKPQTKK
jgi:hypothetical protein